MSSELVSQGNYRAVARQMQTDEGLVWAQFSQPKNGTTQVVISFEILDGMWAGRKVAWFGSFSEKAYERTLQALRYCGMKGDDLMTLPDQVLDQEVSIVVEHNEWEGKVTARVAWVNEPGGGGLRLKNPLSKDALRHLAGQMKSRVKAIPPFEGKKAERGPVNGAPPPAAERQPGADDDLAF